jgi:hypothetical protein
MYISVNLYSSLIIHQVLIWIRFEIWVIVFLVVEEQLIKSGPRAHSVTQAIRRTLETFRVARGAQWAKAGTGEWKEEKVTPSSPFSCPSRWT